MGQFEKKILFYLLDENGDWLTVNSSGVVVPTATETPLNYAPEGWDETELSWTRSTEYWGLFRKATTNFQFHKDGHIILSYIRFTQGTEGYCKLVIKRRDMANLSSSVTLNLFYECELDFSQAVIKKKTTEIPAMEGGVRDLFSAYENTEFEIPIEDIDSETVEFDGITLQVKKNFGNIGTIQYGSGFGSPDDGVYIPLIHLGQDGDYIIGETQDIQLIPGQTYTNPANDAIQWQFKSLRTQTITLTYYGYISYFLDGAATGSLVPAVYTKVFLDETTTGSGPINSNIIAWTGPDLDPGDTNLELVQFTETYSLIADNILVISTGAEDPYGPVAGSLLGVQFIETTGIEGHSIKSVFQLPATEAKAYTYRMLLSKLIGKITNNTAIFGSAYFFNFAPIVDNYIYNTLVTSGTAIRGIGDPKIKTTWAAAWKDARTQWCLGMSVDATSVSVEHISHFLDKDILIYDLGEVSRAEVSTFAGMQHSNIRVGYTDQEYDGLNGRYETNTTQAYKLPKKRATSTLDLVGSYRYDPYGLELFRDKLREKDSTDNRADNEVFVVEVRPGTPDEPKRAQNDTPNYATYNDADIDFLLEKYYNISFTPKRKLIRNGPHVLAAMHLTSGNVEYLTTDKIETLESDLGSGVIIENETLDITDTVWGDLVYLPIIFKMELAVRDSLFTAITAEPNGYMSFSYNGYDFKGFPMDIKYTERNQAHKLELLAHPDTVMSDVIAAFK